MRILVTPSFARRAKRLHANEKKALNKAIRAVSADSEIGDEKAGDLVGVFIYKFSIGNEKWLLAYRIVNKKEIKLLLFGPHENFYRELKR
jgi:mRNA-degrading endonuclease RelE of RelBE toxin-antitoxin system